MKRVLEILDKLLRYIAIYYLGTYQDNRPLDEAHMLLPTPFFKYYATIGPSKAQPALP